MTDKGLGCRDKQRVIYTSPLKALSNQVCIYVSFNSAFANVLELAWAMKMLWQTFCCILTSHKAEIDMHLGQICRSTVSFMRSLGMSA